MPCYEFNNILNIVTSPEGLESVTVPLFKGKAHALVHAMFRGLRLLEHGMQIWERVLMVWLKPLATFGFAARKSTTNAH